MLPLVLNKYDYRYQHDETQCLRTGKGAVMFSSELMAMRAPEAAEVPKKQGIKIGVVHFTVIKPLDEETIHQEAGEALHHNQLAITAENSSITGGSGEAIAGLLMLNPVTPRFKPIALSHAFLAASALPTLPDHGISADAMFRQITARLEA